MKKKRFLVYQQVVGKKEQQGAEVHVDISVNIRNVGASSKEEALGKFVSEFKSKDYVQMLDPIVFELNLLKKID